MLFLAALVVLVQLALAVPTSNTKNSRRLAVHLTNAITGDCDSLVEESAWVITNLTSFQAYPSANSISYFAFSFEDINPGLGLKTSCSNYLPRGSNATVENDRYHLCDSHDVQFKYNGQILQVERWYQDPCLGKPPYDSAIAHGRANVTFTKTRAQDGVLATQVRMEMPITSLS
ncbi:uncharacterized protein SEPMUDRAFT_34938 [Sphaerulina musiva SO2202]|uniref:AA1-like domain-containing protein n=1 Tax=Sphaerulina musiva (strain SO2202) TaxID=692275 RepID=N1QH03_SPHMS|nr:uncharacterized protein SEPMUDRAFT_34938 [Sphaerulina musiva SO2202]EMF16460.1 hypothetical protein SEPMUDRAFT_34938 [Sphaerulina musiva SO2202]